MKSTMTFKEGILYYLIEAPREKITLLLNTVDGSQRSGMPLFFYRYPLYTGNAENKVMQISEDYGFEINRKISLRGLLVLEYIFEEAEFANGALSATIDIEALKWRFGEMGYAILCEMQETRFTAHKDKHHNVNFSLFSNISVKNKNMEICFSNEISALFLVDYLIPTKKIREMLDLFNDNPFQAILFRYMISPVMALSKGMGCDIAIDRIGFGYNPQALTQFETIINYTHSDLFKRHGMILDRGMNKNLRKMKYIEKIYSKELHIFPKIKIKDAMEIEIDTTPAEIIEKGKKQPIDFSTATLTTQMIDKALDMGYNKNEIDMIFTMFKNVFMQMDKPYYQLSATWTHFLKKNSTGFVPMSKVENRGEAENITLNQDMKEISEKYNLSKSDEIETFTMFRNYYTSKEIKNKNWVGIWENWVIKNIQSRTKDTTYKNKVKLETDFYAARLVSKDIELMLEHEGISIGDVTAGKVKVDNIRYRNYPLPPSVGKGEVTLFSWSSREAQFNAMTIYLADQKKTAAEYISIAKETSSQKRISNTKQ